MFPYRKPAVAQVAVKWIARVLALCCVAAAAACIWVERLALPTAELGDRHWVSADAEIKGPLLILSP